jgi:BMFP domain-containing protein YqiC
VKSCFAFFWLKTKREQQESESRARLAAMESSLQDLQRRNEHHEQLEASLKAEKEKRLSLEKRLQTLENKLNEPPPPPPSQSKKGCLIM